MNQELILKAVKAVMDFNESQGDESNLCAMIHISRFSTWVGVSDIKLGEYVFNKHDAKDEDLNNFIEKLNELKGE